MTASTSMSHHEAVASIIAAARTGLPDLVERVAHRIRTEIPCYAAEDVVAPADLRASVRANVDYILDSLTGTARANLSAPDATGRARAAQGVPLAEMLTAYRVGVAELWSALVTAAQGLPGVPADDVIELAGTVFAAQNAYSDAALAAYRDEAREILRMQERERAALVEVILAGAAAKGTLWEVANALRLPLDGAFLVIAAETEPGHDPIPRAESALAVIDVRSVWRLDAELSLGVLSLPDRTRNGAVLTVLNKHATHRIGASPVFGELHQAGWALQLARLALGSNSGHTGVAQFRDSPIDILVAAAPHAALETARAVLGGLLELPEDELDLLLGTFEAWVRASGSATVAGAELFCHPNTVRYRLRRIEAGTGRVLASPGDVAELVTAVRAWRELPHAYSPERKAVTPASPAEPSAGHDAPHAGLPLLLSLAMAQFMVVLDFTIVNVALPSIQSELHVATTTLQWLVSAYAVAFGGFLLLGGRLADSYGRARLYRIGLVVFVLASVSGGLAVEPGLLIASRVIQGIGAALLAPAGLSLLITGYPGEQERSRALGTYGAVVSAGFASGAVLGGLLAEVTWRLVFFVNVPIGIALLAASVRLLPVDPPAQKGQLDVPGAVTATAGVALLVLAVVRAGDTLRAIQPALLGAAAIVLLALFVIRERRAPAPLLDLALLKDRGIAGANLTLIAVGAFSAGQVLLTTLYLQEGRGLSPVLTGLCFIPQAAGAFALAGPAGRLVPALGPRRALGIALFIALLALAGAAVSVLAGSLAGLLAAQFTLGVAARLSQVASTLAGTHGPVAEQSEGTASALLTATRQCGSALGVAIVSAILVAVHGTFGHRTAVGMLATAGFALAGLLATRIVPAGPQHPGQPQPHHLFRHHAGGVP